MSFFLQVSLVRLMHYNIFLIIFLALFSCLDLQIRMAEAQLQKTPLQDMKPEQANKLSKLETWRSELMLLEEQRVNLNSSSWMRMTAGTASLFTFIFPLWWEKKRPELLQQPKGLRFAFSKIWSSVKLYSCVSILFKRLSNRMNCR